MEKHKLPYELFLEELQSTKNLLGDEGEGWGFVKSPDDEIRLFKAGLKIYHFEFERQAQMSAKITEALKGLAEKSDAKVSFIDPRIEMFDADGCYYIAKMKPVSDVVRIKPGQLFLVDGHMYAVFNSAEGMGNLPTGQSICAYTPRK